MNEYFDFGKYSFSLRKNAQGQTTHTVFMEFVNDDKISISELLHRLYLEILNKQFYVNVEKYSKYFAICAFGFRGSVDLDRNWYTMDMQKARVGDVREIKEFMKLSVFTNFEDHLNLNFRELQGEGTKRDTQFRMKLNYFYDNFLDELRKVNPYRYKHLVWNRDWIFRQSQSTVSSKSKGSFLNRIEFYLNNIKSKNRTLNKDEIVELRNELGFVRQESGDDVKRSNKAKEFAMLTKNQECAGCNDIYKRDARTFKTRNGVWYFELHHVISFANSKNGIYTESPDNYVKLCPACHRALTPNRADKDYQLKIIHHILNYDHEALEYVQRVEKQVNSTEDADEFVYTHLK